MLLLQATIGIVNDIADAPADRVAKPVKPIPAGLVRAGPARRLALACGAMGLAVAALSGPPALLVATAGLGAGLAYDIRLKGTAWSWLPYAVGIPLLPLFAWLGAGAAISLPLLLLLPVAAEAGAELSIANALADLERDLATGVTTVVTRVGRAGAGRLAALHGSLVAGGAWISLLAFGGTGPGLVVASAGAATMAAGIAAGLGRSRQARQAGWEVQAVGIAILAAGWALALSAAGRL
jgi:4-hydroxybenzoate polyprenyltransferase